MRPHQAFAQTRINPIQLCRAVRSTRRVKKNHGQVPRRQGVTDYATVAMEQVELYSLQHPGSPSAVGRPRLFIRGELWIALLGPSVEEGIVGIGQTVAAALRAFDAQYLAALRPAVAPAPTVGALSRPTRAVAAALSFRNPKVAPKSGPNVSDFGWPL
jgi:hypothetical protein